MTATEFLADYAARSRTTPEALTAAGRVVVACECGWGYCEGWVVVPAELAARPVRVAGL